MNPLDLINYRKVSELLTGNYQSIRSNNCPKKYAEAVKELTDFVKEWKNKHSKTDDVSMKPQTEP